MACYYCAKDCPRVACSSCAPNQPTDYEPDFDAEPIESLAAVAQLATIRERMRDLGIPPIVIPEREADELDDNELRWSAALNRPEDDGDERAAIQGET